MLYPLITVHLISSVIKKIYGILYACNLSKNIFQYICSYLRFLHFYVDDLSLCSVNPCKSWQGFSTLPELLCIFYRVYLFRQVLGYKLNNLLLYVLVPSSCIQIWIDHVNSRSLIVHQIQHVWGWKDVPARQTVTEHSHTRLFADNVMSIFSSFIITIVFKLKGCYAFRHIYVK